MWRISFDGLDGYAILSSGLVLYLATWSVTNRSKPCSTKPRKQTREAFIRHIISLEHAMATPMPETETCHHLVVLNPAEQQQEVTVVPSQSIVTGSVENAFAPTDIPWPMAERLRGILNLSGVKAISFLAL